MTLAQEEARRSHPNHAGADHGDGLFATLACHTSELLLTCKRIVWIAPSKIKSCPWTRSAVITDRRRQAMSELRITGISVDLVRWPLKMKRRHGVGDIEGSMPGAIVKISTNAGIVGWGEASPWSVFTGTAEANANAIHLYMRPLIVGADPLKVSTLM